MATRDEKLVRKCRDGLLFFMQWTGVPDSNTEPEAERILRTWMESLDWYLGENPENREVGEWKPPKIKE